VGVPSNAVLWSNFPFRCEQQPKPQICWFGFSTFDFFGTLTIEANGLRQRKN
jgi:hypothetical protein